MFVQVFQGPVSDPAKVKETLDRWVAELAPGADGWLGSTAGVTDDGTFVGLARFDSEEAARRNSDRPGAGRLVGAAGRPLHQRAGLPREHRRSTSTTTATSTRPASCR